LPEYLACYDYGQGGVWLYLDAQSADAIKADYPALTVFESAPTWWTSETEFSTRKFSANKAFVQDWLKKLPHE
jgi:hypothetical protein